MELLKRARIFNSNTIKLLAAAFMFIDHLGLLFFPHVLWLRGIGRLAMPLFAFAISEGCRYTKNKARYLAMLFGLGALCQIVYFIVDPTTMYLGILITFSLSVVIIYTMQHAKKQFLNSDTKVWKKFFSVVLFLLTLAGGMLFCRFFTVDYDIYGCLMPVFASLFDFHHVPAPDKWKKLDNIPLRALCMIVPLTGLIYKMAWDFFGAYSLLAFGAILLLFFYNGERGKVRMKYFFYIFYPLHLGILGGLQMLLYMLN